MTLPSGLLMDLKVLRQDLKERNVEKCVNSIHATCLKLWSQEWDEDFSQTMSDPTIRYLALASLKRVSGFKEPKLLTPMLAKFEYLMRLTWVFEIWRIRGTTVPPPSSHKLAQKFARWFTEGEPSTFHSIRTLQHLASSIAYNTMALPRIWWPEEGNYRTMLFHGHSVKLDAITSAFIAMENDMMQVFEEEVLLGFDLRVEYSDIVDNMANTEVGYSMLSDPRNPCFLGAAELIHQSILNDPVQKARFIKGCDNDGFPIWNKMALRMWLLSYTKFESLLLVKAEMTAGSSSRGTEINCLTFKNTHVRPSRGLFMMGSYLAYLCQYHKGSALTQKDKVIPHAFDAHTSDMIIQDLAIARPFAQFAAFLCFPDNTSIHQMYDNYLFANFAKPFVTSDISAVLQTYTLAHVGRQFGMQDWRHISIGFRRKLATSLEELMDQDSQETIGAAQSHHSRSTENRIYGISAMALASGNADDIFPLYLKHSTDWQDVCKVHAGGKLQPYRKCLAKDLPPPNIKPKNPQSDLMEEITSIIMPSLQTMMKNMLTDTMKELTDNIAKDITHSVLKNLSEKIQLNCAPSSSVVRKAMSLPYSSLTD